MKIMAVKIVIGLLILILVPSAHGQPGYCTTSNITDQQFITWSSDNYSLGNIRSCTNGSNLTTIRLMHREARTFSMDHQYRRCYDLPLVIGQEYLLSATILCDPMMQFLANTSFNISLGATTLSSLNSSHDILVVEVVFVTTTKHTNICLLKENGNAYMSKLELRPINDAAYLEGDSSIVLRLVARVNLGNTYKKYRYPVHPAARIWSRRPGLKYISISASAVATMLGANTLIPLEVLRTAVEDATRLEFVHTNLDTSNDEYLIILHFVELNENVQSGERVFDIYVNGLRKYERMDIVATSNSSNYRQVSMRLKSNGSLNISLVKFPDSVKHGPLCNAYEIFQVHHRAAQTMQRDVDAMTELKNMLMPSYPKEEILNKWNGDPCVPCAWEGLACQEKNGMLVVSRLDLSSSNIQKPLPTVINKLKDLKNVKLRDTNFKGPIANRFATVPRLSKLSIKMNNYSKNHDQLHPASSETVNVTVVSVEGPSQTQSQHIYVIGGVAGGSISFSIALGVFFTCFYQRKRRLQNVDYPVIKNAAFKMDSINIPYFNPAVESFSLQLIKDATSNFQTMIGEGGFGSVYRGTLPNSEEVAVKVRSSTSTQGTREFDNEVTFLSAIKHENLVPLLGYCCENNQQILVYPFMSNGSLQDRLYGEASKRKILDWTTRLSIALGAARGIMYLHTFAGRCIIHRDIKSSNILLDHSMSAKVADFGFSKYAPQEGDSGASLEVRGTAGYLDPEYYSTQQLSTKSDVFSFGVVLLEIITGREPLNVHRPRHEWSLVEWAKPYIAESRIDEIVDANIKGGYHAEAMYRVAEAASLCIEPFATYRPDMIDIVRELEDALIIENNASEYMRSIESMGGSNRYYSIERKVLPTILSPIDPSANFCPMASAAPQPR